MDWKMTQTHFSLFSCVKTTAGHYPWCVCVFFFPPKNSLAEAVEGQCLNH